MEQNREARNNPSPYGQLIFDKWEDAQSGIKIASSANCVIRPL